jgi:AhpD family alkylhydroperoxidase
MIRDWKTYKGQITGAVKEIGATNPDLVKAYAALHHANSASKHLDGKTRELIALAVAATLRCDGCINVHSESALRHGATKDEVVDALGVAILVNAGATMVYSAHAIDALKTYTQNPATEVKP